MMRLTISSKGWVVIPADLRKKYGLKPGDAVNIVDYGGVLALVPAMKDPVREAMGLFKSEESLTELLLEERRKDREREDRD
jgi:AbrB family looped-hinge helix DNA binding protein